MRINKRSIIMKKKTVKKKLEINIDNNLLEELAKAKLTCIGCLIDPFALENEKELYQYILVSIEMIFKRVQRVAKGK